MVIRSVLSLMTMTIYLTCNPSGGSSSIPSLLETRPSSEQPSRGSAARSARTRRRQGPSSLLLCALLSGSCPASACDFPVRLPDYASPWSGTRLMPAGPAGEHAGPSSKPFARFDCELLQATGAGSGSVVGRAPPERRERPPHRRLLSERLVNGRHASKSTDK
eukprot:3594999-Pyramimonas_sp.AAC.1